MKIRSLIFKEGQDENVPPLGSIITLDDKVMVDAGWYATAMKHYCGTCEQWFKTASANAHARFKHKS